jgi:hypothetical protein
MPFVLQERTIHIGGVQKKPMKGQGEKIMNWIFDAYTNVYQTAMMQSHKPKHDAAPAKERVHAKRAIAKRAPLFGFLKRG